MEKINCILVDDSSQAVDRLEDLLLKTKKVNEIHKICDPVKAIDLILRHKPNIVFIDVEMPTLSGFKVLQKVQQQMFFPCFIFTTGFEQYAIKAIKAEAFDYLLKPIDLDDLIDTLNRYIIKNKKIHLPENCCLSDREKEVLELVTEGKTSNEIASQLNLSKHTVDTHRRRIKRKIK